MICDDKGKHATCKRLQVVDRCVLLNLGTTIHLVVARHKFKPHAQLHDTQWSRSKIAQRGKKSGFSLLSHCTQTRRVCFWSTV